MIIRKLGGWVFYIGDTSELKPNTSGKWMYFFDESGSDKNVEDLCQSAVESNVVVEAKHTDAPKGVACFYLNIDDDVESHKKVISFFLENDMVPKTKAGRLYNISFKLDDQTRSGQYGEEFVAKLSLNEFVDLDTGEWLDNGNI